jgi:Concanavalin A-like lectin/glucanases superfamily
MHLSSLQNGSGIPCFDLLALTSNGSIIAQAMISLTNTIDLQGPTLPLNTWTHLAVVHGVSNGMRLFVNGEVVASSRPSISIPINTHAVWYVTLANTNPQGSPNPTDCPAGNSTSIVSGPFAGAIDDFRLYVRELDAQEICVLANM